MCWSKKSSLTTFIIGSLACAYLYHRNIHSDRLYALFFGFVIFMQFLEFLIWSDQPNDSLDKNCKTAPYKGCLNNVASQVASIQNLLQPLVAGLLLLYFMKKKDNVFSSCTLKLILVVYAAAVLFWIVSKKVYSKKLCTTPLGKNHLQWPWIKNEVAGNSIWIAYFVALALVLIAMNKIPSGKALSIYLLLTMFISMSVYPFKKAMGSWWCVAAVGGPLLKIAFPHI